MYILHKVIHLKSKVKNLWSIGKYGLLGSLACMRKNPPPQPNGMRILLAAFALKFNKWRGVVLLLRAFNSKPSQTPPRVACCQEMAEKLFLPAGSGMQMVNRAFEKSR